MVLVAIQQLGLFLGHGCRHRTSDRLAVAQDSSRVHAINTFPIILGISLVVCLIATFLTKAEEDEVLKDFYRRVRPWGFWGPIHALVIKEDPGFQRNKDFFRDMFNIVIGTIWQTCFIVLAMFLVTRHFKNFAITLVVLAVTCFILKKTWYDKLPGTHAGRRS